MTETIQDKICFLKREVAECEEYIKECKRALVALAKEAWDQGVRDCNGQYEVRESRPQPLNTTSFRNAYPDIYKGTVELLQEQFIPEITKASITRYLETKHYSPEEIARIISECCDEPKNPSYNVYAYKKQGAE